MSLRSWLCPIAALAALVSGACEQFGRGSATSDAGADASGGVADAGRSGEEAGSDAGVVPSPAVCPSECTGGCDGGCTILDPTSDQVVCPADLPCTVRCTSHQVCKTTLIECGTATRCSVVCEGLGANKQSCDGARVVCGAGPCSIACLGEQSCNGAIVAPRGANDVCIECGGVEGCNSMKCQRTPAKSRCVGNCSATSDCGPLDAAPACD